MKDLLKLYSFESVHLTDQEQDISDWICKWLDANNITGYQRLGRNIYKLDGENDTILSAHLDQVRTNGRAVHFFLSDDEKITAYNDKWERTSLGADDKNGIWLIMQALKFDPTVNFIISAGEECGCLGIKMLEDKGVLDAIDTNQYCIVMDRKGNTDMLKSGGGTTYCSTLAQALCNFSEQDFTVATGGLSDTATISSYCESVNMSTAYDHPHTALETTDFARLKEMADFIVRVLDEFVHYPTDPTIYNTTTSIYNRGGYYDRYYSELYGA